MGKCGVFNPSHSHQVIFIPISIPMKLDWRNTMGPTGAMGIPNTHLELLPTSKFALASPLWKQR